MSEIDTFSSMLPEIDDVSNMLLNSILLGVRVLGDGNVVSDFFSGEPRTLDHPLLFPEDVVLWKICFFCVSSCLLLVCRCGC